MKSAVNTTEIFKYILLFTFLFAEFLALAINYNRVFKIKNETLTIIEKYEGMSNKSLKIINNYLKNNAYNTKGVCEIGEYGIKDLNNISYEKVVSSDDRYLYCFSDKINRGNNNNDKIYYNVNFFYKFNLPFIGDIFTFSITGETKSIKYYSLNQRL